MDNEIIKGDRSKSFKNFVTNILKNLPPSLIEKLTTYESLQLYSDALTSRRVNNIRNYEIFEQLGDVTINKFVVYYMYERFPQLRNTGGVDVVAKLKIKYVSGETLQGLAEDLNMWPFITAYAEDKNGPLKRKKLMEDVFEAFMGATEYLIDFQIYKTVGLGYNILYKLLKEMYDKIDISLKYEILVDAKTRLNELIAAFTIGKIRYYNGDLNQYGINTSDIILETPEKNFIKIGSGRADTIRQAQEEAAENAIKYLYDKRGYYKDPPERFRIFSNWVI
ncbi:ribonuclease 3 [Spirochaetia bacterium]|nr:ribonuclease 3 [Spirochaetia bacterium]